MELTYRMENGHRLPNLDVPEELKASDQMKWVGLMNSIQAAAEEVALAELIYTDV